MSFTRVREQVRKVVSKIYGVRRYYHLRWCTGPKKLEMSNWFKFQKSKV